MFRFIHAADLHLDSALRGLQRYAGAPVDEIRGATRGAFDNLIRLAISESVDFILLAGDLYDGDWKDYNTGLYFVDCMSQLRKADIPVFIISGNHDAASQLTKRLRLPENVRHLSSSNPESCYLEEISVAIHGQGFANRAEKRDLTAKYPLAAKGYFNIGLLHTCLEGKPGHEPYAPCSLDGLKSKGYDYWALGHIHKREIVCEAPWVVFPGNIQGRHIRETGPKGCSIVEVFEGEVVSVQHHNLDVMRWQQLELDISVCDSADETIEPVKQAIAAAVDAAEGRPLAIRIILTGVTDAHSDLCVQREQWEQEYRALANDSADGVWLEKLKLQTTAKSHSVDNQQQDDVLVGLLESIDEIDFNEEVAAKLMQEVEPMLKKVRPLMVSGMMSSYQDFDPALKENFQQTLEDVKQLLQRELLTSQRKD